MAPSPAAPSDASAPARRSNATLAAFAASCLPYAALGLPVYVTLPEFYASQIGVPLAVVGLVFMLVRIGDIVLDPLFGAIIDRTRTRFGRYRVWMLASAPVLMISVAMLFFVERGAGPAHLIVWLVIMYLGYSASLLSQMSWASVLSSDYDQRSRIYGWWQAANIVGVLAVLLIPPVVQALGQDYLSAVRLQGAFIVVLLPLALFITVRFTPEPRPASDTAPRESLTAWLSLLRSRALQRLLTSDLMLGAARGTVAALFFYFFEHAKGFERAETSILLLVYFVAGLVGAPVWAWAAMKWGKHQTLAVASVYFALTLLIASLLTPQGALVIAAVAIFATGLAFGAADLLLRAMMADVSDEVLLDTGTDRTGLLFSILTATSKLGYAISVGTFIALQQIGFDASIGAVNTPDVIGWLTGIFVGVPMVLLLISALVLRGYPLDQARHARIRSDLDAGR